MGHTYKIHNRIGLGWLLGPGLDVAGSGLYPYILPKAFLFAYISKGFKYNFTGRYKLSAKDRLFSLESQLSHYFKNKNLSLSVGYAVTNSENNNTLGAGINFYF